jgi:hypothetical protein
MKFEFGENSTYMPSNLSTLEIGLILLSFSLLTITILWTILDYTNKGKHIDKKRW